MSNIKVFESELFGKVRMIDSDGVIYAVANDVARALGYSNPSKATNDHCKNGKMLWGNDSLGRPQQFKFIPEGDIYRLIMRSRLETAEQFESWVVDKILPTIRRTGGVVTNTDMFVETYLPFADETTKSLFRTQLKVIEEQNNKLQQQSLKIEADKPKVRIAEAISGSETSILVGDLAKILKQNGIDTGQNRLFAWLRDNGYLIKRKGINRNMPTQRSMDMGLFEIKEKPIERTAGTYISKTTRVTGKGQSYFIDRLLREKGEE